MPVYVYSLQLSDREWTSLAGVLQGCHSTVNAYCFAGLVPSLNEGIRLAVQAELLH